MNKNNASFTLLIPVLPVQWLEKETEHLNSKLDYMKIL